MIPPTQIVVPNTKSYRIRIRKYYAAYGQAATLLRSVSRPEPIAPSFLQSILRNDLANNVQASKRKLPPLNLPFVSGSYESWLRFHDIFKSLVDDDKDLPAIEKLYHLKGCLKDEAAEILPSLELSSENYKEAFITCLKKLFSSRGISKTIYSDNATNFVGASRELVELYNSVKSNERDEAMQNFLTQQMVTWHFIPPRSPHFGGF